MKICTKCHKELDESCFSTKNSSKDGLNTICRICKSEYDKLFYLKEKDKIKQEGKITINYDSNIINNDYKILLCEKCGNEFKVGRKSDGKNFLVRKYCPNCSTATPTKIRICKQCGKEFSIERSSDGRHFRNIWKCNKCREPKQTKTLVCEKCGKEFEVTKYEGTNSFRKVKFCSDLCASTLTEYKNNRVQFINKYTKCKYCGKQIKLQLTDDFHWSLRTVCDDCLKPKEKPKEINKICTVCGKEFTVGLMPCGNYSGTKYCSDACALEGFKTKCNKTCQEKYGVDYPCLTDNAIQHNIGNVVSETNKRFAKLLDEHSIKYEQEFRIGPYSYDFRVKDTLIEINPTYTHNCLGNHFNNPKDKFYHHNKSKFAINSGFICICIWDWVDWDSIINLFYKNKLVMKQTDIELYYSKNKEKIKSSNPFDEKLLKENYLPIYTDGYIVK